MPRLPRLSGRDVVRVFESLGWEKARQSSSHIILVREGHQATLSVPDHKEVALGTLRSLIRSAGLSVEALSELLARCSVPATHAHHRIKPMETETPNGERGRNKGACTVVRGFAIDIPTLLIAFRVIVLVVGLLSQSNF